MDKERGKRIKEARIACGITVAAELARRIEVNQNTVWRYETGDLNPSVTALSRIAEVTSADMYWLATGRLMRPVYPSIEAA